MGEGKNGGRRKMVGWVGFEFMVFFWRWIMSLLFVISMVFGFEK